MSDTINIHGLDITIPSRERFEYYRNYVEGIIEQLRQAKICDRAITPSSGFKAI